MRFGKKGYAAWIVIHCEKLRSRSRGSNNHRQTPCRTLNAVRIEGPASVERLTVFTLLSPCITGRSKLGNYSGISG